MKAVEVIQANIHAYRDEYLGTIADVTPAMAQWVPPGVAHCIGALMLHILNTEDAIVHQMLQGKPTLWETGAWEKKVKAPFNMLMKVESRGLKVDPAALPPYAQAVFAATDAYLKSLDDQALDRIVETPIGKMPAGVVLDALIAGHAANINGEISALKGVQGKKGYPF